MNSGLLQAYLSLAEDPVCAARDKFGVVHRAILKDSSPTGYVVWLIDNYRKIIAALPTDYHPEQMHNAALR